MPQTEQLTASDPPDSEEVNTQQEDEDASGTREESCDTRETVAIDKGVDAQDAVPTVVITGVAASESEVGTDANLKEVGEKRPEEAEEAGPEERISQEADEEEHDEVREDVGEGEEQQEEAEEATKDNTVRILMCAPNHQHLFPPTSDCQLTIYILTRTSILNYLVTPAHLTTFALVYYIYLQHLYSQIILTSLILVLLFNSAFCLISKTQFAHFLSFAVCLKYSILFYSPKFPNPLPTNPLLCRVSWIWHTVLAVHPANLLHFP